MTQEHDSRPTPARRPRTQWFDAEVRPISRVDAGLIVVGRTHSLWFVGRVARDGETIAPLPGAAAGDPDIPASLVVAYALLDPPVPLS